MFEIFLLSKIAVVIVGLAFLSWIDFKKKIVPNKVLLILLILRAILAVFEAFLLPGDLALSTLRSDFLGGLLIGGGFILISLFAKGSIGMGDAKLFGVIGLFLGVYWALLSATAAFLCGLFVSARLVFVKKQGRKATYPLVPCILVGTVLVSIWILFVVFGG